MKHLNEFDVLADFTKDLFGLTTKVNVLIADYIVAYRNGIIKESVLEIFVNTIRPNVNSIRATTEGKKEYTIFYVYTFEIEGGYDLETIKKMFPINETKSYRDSIPIYFEVDSIQYKMYWTKENGIYREK